MIVALVHLLWFVLEVFLLFSYITVGFVSFVQNNEQVKTINLWLRILMWLLAPLMVLDVLCERLFGWSVLQ